MTESVRNGVGLNFSTISNQTLNGNNMNEQDTGCKVLNEVIIPALSGFGIIGNILNLKMLHHNTKTNKYLEKCAVIGMSALAVSDIMFCLGVLPLFFWKSNTIYHSRNILFIWANYQGLYTDVWIKTSTWYTVITAGMRYIAICYPLNAGIWLKRKKIISLILITPIAWLIFMLPLLWQFNEKKITRANLTVYYYRKGAFSQNTIFFYIFSSLWTFFGYVIPVILLIFFNYNLIKSIRRSRIFRRNYSSKEMSNTFSLNISLISLVMMYIFLVSPSEIYHFYSKFNRGQESKLIKSTLNLLQTINFSCTFLLYLSVNAMFGKVITSTIICFKTRLQNDAESVSLNQRHSCTMLTMN